MELYSANPYQFHNAVDNPSSEKKVSNINIERSQIDKISESETRTAVSSLLTKGPRSQFGSQQHLKYRRNVLCIPIFFSLLPVSLLKLTLWQNL